MLGFIFALFVSFLLVSAVEAAPRDGRVVEGAGSIERSGNHTDIRQRSDFLATSWGSFNIAAHESVQAHQPGASSRLLIRVDGGGATNIAGSYTSNGITILENQNGVQFSRGAIVNVGGLLATSSRISGVAGANWQLNGTGGAVVNHGQIVAGAGGAILAAVKVQNTGDITAKGGDVALGAGSSFTVDFAGSMVGFEITKAASGASITNSGKIEAQGGVVALSAQEAQAVRTNVVSVGGVVKATRIERRGGVVYLSGGTQGIAEVSGDVSASRKVQTTGEYVVVKGSAVLRAPEILVGGDFQGKGDVPTSRRTLVEAGALLDAGANGRVPKGRVIVWSDETTWFNGDISAPGGFAEVSGKRDLAAVNLPGINVGAGGTLLLDPLHISIVETSTTLLPAAALGGTTLAVASINSFTGNLSLAASNTIIVNVPINKLTGDLSLIAGTIMILASINNGTGNVTLTGDEGGVIIGANITTTGNIILTGVASSTQPAIRFENGARVLTGGNITLNGSAGVLTSTTEPARNGGSVTLDATSGILSLNSGINTGTNNLILTGATIQIGRRGADTRIVFSGQNITLTSSANGIQIGRFNGRGTFFTNGIVANLTVNAQGVLTIAADITVASTAASGGGIVLTGGSIAFGAAARTITGGAIALRGAAGGTADLTLTARGTLRVNSNIALTGGTNPALTLMSTEGGVRILAAEISTTGNMTLSGATGINLNSGGAKTLSGAAITLNGNARSNRDLTLTTTSGALTINNNITVTGATRTLALRGAGAIVATTGRPRLAASTVRLTQIDAFAAGENGIGLFRFRPGSLMLNTDAAQDVHDWMISPGRDVTITSAGSVRVAAAIGADVLGRNLGVRSLTLVSMGADIRIEADITTTGNITLNGATGINLNGGARTITGGAIALRGAAEGTADLTLMSTAGAVRILADISTTGDLTLNGATGINLRGGVRTLAGAAITLNGVVASNRAVTINASGILGFNGDITTTGTNALTLMGAMIQIGRRGTDRVIELRGGAIALTSAGGIQVGRLNGRGAFLTNGIVASLTVNAQGALTIAGNITVASTAASGGDIGLTASGTLTINNDINIGTSALTLTSGAGVIDNGGNIGRNRPRLTASTVSLTQIDAFAAEIGPFRLRAGSLVLITEAEQDVLDWMIVANRNLTVTSAGIVLVDAAIGGSGGRNLGNGSLTLMSTGGAVRILADISTGGDLTLNGGTNGINLRGGVGAKTLSGAIVTLTGDARSNRALTITATGVLTINNNINIGTRALSLTGTSLTFGSSVALTAGDYSFTPERICNTGTMPSCTTVTP